MQYRVVFEFQSEDGAMSDVYNYRDEQQAQDKFAELRDEIVGAVGHTQCATEASMATSACSPSDLVSALN